MPKSITPKLGIRGLKHLDAVILSALATNATVLLIGPHGSAKTLLAQRVAGALGSSFRHYNTSLLNYDDLVGYPIPDQENKKLDFIQTPGTIWNAEFILFDEISRARPEIQNKVFPIVHEHRVQGIELEHLSHCWAAMNPPSDGEEEQDLIYSGSWSLDAALADRFRFVLKIPGFNELNGETREHILSDGDRKNGRPPGFKTLIRDTRKQLKSLTGSYRQWPVRYLTSMIPLLEKTDLMISGRRARFLFENILALYSSELVLYGESDLSDVALRAVLSGLPHGASGKAVDQGKILLAHKQAVRESGESADSFMVRIRGIRDPVKRVEFALRENPDKTALTQIVSDTFASLDIVQRYVWVNLAFPGISENKGVAATVLELMAEVESKIYQGAVSSFSEAMSPNNKRWSSWQNLSKVIARAESDESISQEHVAVARALFFIENEDVSMDQVRVTFQDIKERMSSCE
ncbi:MAG: MoxR family ATPase [Deltaproteobacteria bacterium]|nr:MoxR family ATPase [Deltaproteobacteria bacterium]